MATKVAHSPQITQSIPSATPEPDRQDVIGCSVGIMAYNEEANIAHTLSAVLSQQGPTMRVEEIIVVASGCTDRTVPIVADIALREPRVHLCVQEKREGKASAINLFLKEATREIVILIGADVIPEEGAIESLCAPFKDPSIGMVGGRPVPINDPETFMGHAVHLLWRLHDRVARVTPKLGEVIAFRNVISGIPTNSAVDEISIQALISQLDYKLIYEPDCVIYNKGPVNLRDFLKQRRRIYAGHLKVRAQQNYEASTMKVSPIARQLISCRDFTMSNPRQTMWTFGAICIEAFARCQGSYDFWRKREHHIWQMVDSTKNFELEQHKLRRVSNAQSVIVFRFILSNAKGTDVQREREDREANEAGRQLLPQMRAHLRKEDKLTSNGPGIMTAVVRAEQHGANEIAERIKATVESTPVRVGVRGREVNVTVTYSTLTFASKASNGQVTVSGPLIDEAMLTALTANNE